MRFALFREVPKRQRRKKRKLNSGAAVRKGSDESDGEEEEEASDEEQVPAPAERMTTPGRTARAPVQQDPIWGDESQDISMAVDDEPATGIAGPVADGTIHPQR
jgi:DNA replication licensing factor MCM3